MLQNRQLAAPRRLTGRLAAGRGVIIWKDVPPHLYTRGMADDPLQGWHVDLPLLYGASEWERREKFHLVEVLRPVPGRDLALVMYAVGEVGVGKQVGRLAALADRTSPRPLFKPGGALFWDLGDGTFRFSSDGAIAYCYEFVEVKKLFGRNPTTLACRLWGLDFDRRRVGRLPGHSIAFDFRQGEIDALDWKSW
jgi:hypothetical protein